MSETVRTRIKTSPGPGVGSGNSSGLRASGPPNSWSRKAFIAFPFRCWIGCVESRGPGRIAAHFVFHFGGIDKGLPRSASAFSCRLDEPGYNTGGPVDHGQQRSHNMKPFLFQLVNDGSDGSAAASDRPGSRGERARGLGRVFAGDRHGRRVAGAGRRESASRCERGRASPGRVGVRLPVHARRLSAHQPSRRRGSSRVRVG